MVSVVAESSFAHGAATYRKGEIIELPEQIVADLEKAKLVRRAGPTPESKMQQEPANKHQQASTQQQPGSPITSESVGTQRPAPASRR